MERTLYQGGRWKGRSSLYQVLRWYMIGFVVRIERAVGVSWRIGWILV